MHPYPDEMTYLFRLRERAMNAIESAALPPEETKIRLARIDSTFLKTQEETKTMAPKAAKKVIDVAIDYLTYVAVFHEEEGRLRKLIPPVVIFPSQLRA